MTASRNRGGLFLRSRVVPVNPNTERQGEARANMAQAVNAWTNILTDGNREAWSSYAQGTPVVDRLGDQLILSGQQMFVKCTLPRLVAGLPIIAAGPIVAGLATTPTFDPGSGAPDIGITGGLTGEVTVEGAGTTGDLNVYMSQPTSPSRTVSHAKRAWALIKGPPVADVFTLTATAASMPYDLVAGLVVRLTVVFLADDGRVSTEAFRDLTIGA